MVGAVEGAREQRAVPAWYGARAEVCEGGLVVKGGRKLGGEGGGWLLRRGGRACEARSALAAVGHALPVGGVATVGARSQGARGAWPRARAALRQGRQAGRRGRQGSEKCARPGLGLGSGSGSGLGLGLGLGEGGAPVKPFSHAHVPFWQMPCPEQSAGHVLSEQSNPAVAYARAA